MTPSVFLPTLHFAQGSHLGSVPRFKPRLLTVAVLSACATMAMAAGNTQPALPAGTLPTGGTVVGSSKATITSTGNQMVINQTSNQATFNWNSFNIAQGSGVRFNQPSSSAEAMNYIGGGNPSIIQGTLSANGKVYLVNQNGILFDGSAQVNVNTLIASSLYIDPTTFANGITTSLLGKPSPVQVATLMLNSAGQMVDASGQVIYTYDASHTAGQVANYGTIRSVQVDGPSGQVVNNAASGQPVAPGGSIMLFAPEVENHGVITANNGQVILAAGGTVYLQVYNDPTGASPDPNDLSMRGLLVKVTAAPDTALDVTQLVAAQKASTAANLGGQIESNRGNTTLTGLFVNQSGLVSANTATTVNGSIWLMAESYDGTNTTYGTLKTSKDSVTQTLPVDDGTTLPNNSQYTDNSLYNNQTIPHYQSVIKLIGENIDHEGAAVAPGGRIVVGKEYVNNTVLPDGTGRVYLGANSVLSAAGDWVNMAASDSYLTFKLGSLDLANNPLQKGGYLINQTVTVDIRQPAPLLFDTSSQINNIKRTVQQLATAGGAITVNTGEFVSTAGSTVDVSGGGYNYAAGTATTTFLFSNGRLYNIQTAPTNLQYSAIVNQTSKVQGYVQGANAGLLAIDAKQMALAGKFAGGTTVGPYQRTKPPAGGKLILGTQAILPSKDSAFFNTVMDASAANSQDLAGVPYALKDIQFGPAPQTRQQISDALSGLAADPLNAAFPTSLTDKVLLPLDLFGGSTGTAQGTTSQGFGGLTIRASGDISVPQGVNLNLGTNGSLLWLASQIYVEGSIAAQGGSLLFNRNYDNSLAGTTLLGAHSSLSTAGGWINDSAVAGPVSAPDAINGGTVTIGSLATLTPGSQIDVSGGALLNAAGKLSYGTGGSITLPTSDVAGVSLLGYSGGKGGSLTLNAVQGDTVDIGGSSANALSPDFFAQGGFTQYNLNGAAAVNFLASVHPVAIQRGVSAAAGFAQTGTAFSTISNLLTNTPYYLRSAASLSVNTAASTATPFQLGASETGITVANGVTLGTDPGGNIKLASKTLMDIEGGLSAPGGQINLSLDPGNSFYYDTSTGSFNALKIGNQAVISAAGTFLPSAGQAGLITGQVLPGGTVTITANKNDLIMAPGALIDVSGASHAVDLPYGAGYRRTNVASEGGSITLNATENAYLDGSFKGNGGDVSVAGGSFSLNLAYNGAHDLSSTYAYLLTQGQGNNDPLATAALTFLDPSLQALGHSLVVSQSPTALARTGSTSSSMIGNLVNAQGDFITPLQANISADQLVGGGFDRVLLSSDSTILFKTGVSNFAPRTLLRLDAPELAVQSGTVTIGSGLNRRTAQLQIFNTPGSFRLSTNLSQSQIDQQSLLQLSANIGSVAAQVPVPTRAGSGTLTLDAGQIGLAGNITVNGTSNVTLSSSGDLVFEGFPVKYQTPNSDTDPIPLIATLQGLNGQLSSAGNITLQASQIYPATAVNYTVAVADVSISGLTQTQSSGLGGPLSLNVSQSPVSGGLLKVEGNGNAQGPVLSAGGMLTLNADNIDQAGTLRAPLGNIELQGTSSVTLENGSLTSVSALGEVIPYGLTQSVGQSLWYGNLQTQAPPAKQIDIKATSVNFASGATVDLSGGGDIAAMEFVPGIGGSKDVLAAAGTYAILPGVTFPVADSQLASMDAIQVNSATAYNSVTLADGSSLAAGTYVLLPAYYALLPGAYLVKAQTGSPVTLPGTVLTQNDGSVVVAGKLGFAGTGIAQSTWSGFSVQSGAAALSGTHAQGQYLVNGSEFFAAQATKAGTAAPALPQDGGNLSMGATASLSLKGNLLAQAASGGAIGQVDIYGAQLAIVANGASAPAGYTQVQADGLSSMKASVMVGGKRTGSAAAESVEVFASDVSVDLNGGNVTLPELWLVAKDNLTVSGDSTLTASGNVGSKAGTLTIAPNSDGSQYGALLGLSSGQLASVVRSGNVNQTTGGNLNVAAGAQLNAAGGSIAVDSTGTPVMGGVMNSTSLAIGAGQIALGAVPANSTALTLNDAQLAALGSATNYLLHSYSGIDVYGKVSLGTEGKGSLTLDSAGLIGHDAGGQGGLVQLSANQITLENLSGVTSTSAGDGTGNLTLNASKLVLGNSSQNGAGFSLAGFNQATIKAGEISLQGTASSQTDANNVTTQYSSTLNVGMALNIATARIDAGSTQANQQILAQDAQKVWHLVTITQAGTGGTDAMPGGQLLIAGSSVDFGSTIAMKSGRVTLAAHGTSATDGVTLEDGANIDLSAYQTTFVRNSANITQTADAGRLALTSTNGSVAALGGSNINLDGGATGGNAGMLTVTALNGTATLNGTLAATAAAGSSGSASISAGNLNNFTALNTKLQAGGFNQSRHFRATRGDIDVANTVTARHVQLVADTGNITVEGLIDASGNVIGSSGAGGSVELDAGKGISVSGTIKANGTSSDLTAPIANGGTVGLYARGGALNFASTGLIDVSALGKSSGGQIVFSAPRTETASTASVNTTLLGTVNVAGGAQTVASEMAPTNGSIILEGFQSYSGITNTSAASATTSTVYTDFNNFMTNEAGLTDPAWTTLQAANPALTSNQLAVRAAVELDSSSDMAVDSAWDLTGPTAWLPTGANEAGGRLVLRAAGNLNVNARLGLPDDTSLPPASGWTLQLAGGADLPSANVQAVQSSSTTGDVTLASGVKITTSTGDIVIAAGRDFVAAAPTSVIYTTGASISLPIMNNKPLSYAAPSSGVNFVNGGSISITADRDATGTGSYADINSWLRRNSMYPGALLTQPVTGVAGFAYLPAYWWVDRNGNNAAKTTGVQGIATLGGGDIAITAGNDVSNLLVASTSSRSASPSAELEMVNNRNNIPSQNEVYGGGDVSIDAGSNVLGGQYLVSLGTAKLSAGGNIGGLTAATNSTTAPAFWLMGYSDDPAQQGAHIQVQALGSISLGTVSNPTLEALVGNAGTAKTNTTPGYLGLGSYFFSYSPVDSLAATAVGGDMSLLGAEGSAAVRTANDVLPPIFSAVALQGNVDSGAHYFSNGAVKTNTSGQANADLSFYQYPDSNGEFLLLAGQSVHDLALLESDFSPASLTTASDQTLAQTDYPKSKTYTFTSPLVTDAKMVTHASLDGYRYAVVAEAGSISNSAFYFPQQSVVAAGQDIANVQLDLQNLQASNLSMVSAGRDLYFTNLLSNGTLWANMPHIQIGGTGTLLVDAGRDISLSAVAPPMDPNYPTVGLDNVTRIDAIGYTGNASLPQTDAAAAMTIMAGIDPGKLGQAQANQLFSSLLNVGLNTGGNPTAYNSALNTANSLIATLFPDARTHQGDITMYNARISSSNSGGTGGNIDLMAPYGNINVGLPTANSGRNIGIYTSDGGGINTYLAGDLNVNLSKLATFQGGDILLYTSGNGSTLDAGRGSRSASTSSPPLRVPVKETVPDPANPQNTITKVVGYLLQPPMDVSGSGIRTASFDPDGGGPLNAPKPGDVYLVAPTGTVNAGEAGVSSAGGLVVAALVVKNADNFTASGGSVGVPSVSGGAPAAPANTGDAASSAGKAADSMMQAGNTLASNQDLNPDSFRPSFISVEVLGFGDTGSGGCEKDAGGKCKAN